MAYAHFHKHPKTSVYMGRTHFKQCFTLKLKLRTCNNCVNVFFPYEPKVLEILQVCIYQMVHETSKKIGPYVTNIFLRQWFSLQYNLYVLGALKIWDNFFLTLKFTIQYNTVIDTFPDC